MNGFLFSMVVKDRLRLFKKAANYHLKIKKVEFCILERFAGVFAGSKVDILRKYFAQISSLSSSFHS
jgi:hypothetical protein